MTALSEAELDRLVKLCGMLGSSFAGERVVAAEKASEFISSRKLTWGELLRPRSAESPPPPAPGSGWRRIARECLAVNAEIEALSDWGHRFCQVIAERRWPPTDEAAAGADQDRRWPGGGSVRTALADHDIHLRDNRSGEHRTACPECAQIKARPSDDALAVKIDDLGAVWTCHRCGWKGAVGPVRSSTAHAGTHAPPAAEPQRQVNGLAEALALFRAAQPVTPGTLAARYLEARCCGLPHPDGDLRFFERHRHPSGRVGPALVALVTDAVTGAPMTVHRTWIRSDGTKAPVEKPRLLWPGLPKLGGVVRLWRDSEVTMGLCVAEGIETALTAARAFGHAWSCIDAGNLAALPVLAGIEALTIVADHDPTGLAARDTCTKRWLAAGVEVHHWTAPNKGADLNDFAAAAP